MRRRTIGWPACCLGLMLTGAVPVQAQPATYGMVSRVLTVAEAEKMLELGGSAVRLPFGWDVIESGCKGCFIWTTTDAWVAEARRSRLAIFGTLAYSPRWANGGHTTNYPPLNYQDWYDFVYTVVSRYRNDITLWGIWNEPNLDQYWYRSDLREYQKLATTARAAIRAANPAARVLGPEVSHGAVKDGWYVGAMQSMGDLFDIVTVHWYADGPQLEFMMDQMVRPFARGKDVWLTESGMRPCEGLLGEAGQLAFYNKVLTAFLPRRSWWTGLMFYNLYDPPEPLDCGSAITRPDYSNRPAFTLYQRFIRQYP